MLNPHRKAFCPTRIQTRDRLAVRQKHKSLEELFRFILTKSVCFFCAYSKVSMFISIKKSWYSCFFLHKYFPPHLRALLRCFRDKVTLRGCYVAGSVEAQKQPTISVHSMGTLLKLGLSLSPCACTRGTISSLPSVVIGHSRCIISFN